MRLSIPEAKFPKDRSTIMELTSYQTHRCGELNETHADVDVLITGWVHRRRDHGNLIFIDLRDSSGLVQIVFNPDDDSALHQIASDLRVEYVLQIGGAVVERKAGAVNEDISTGKIEIKATKITVLNESLTPPFPLNQDSNVDEATRLRYRYLDLRRERMQNNLKLRHQIVKSIRSFMDDHDFIEVETPVLGLATPEGARDYLVPSRVHPGHFYALPQSPQQWKQLLMVAGFERYYQIARCYRDEDLRADRQPEFTQLDFEMSFVTEEDVMTLTESLFCQLGDLAAGERTMNREFPRITYAESMELYGTDKPDLRYELHLQDLTKHAISSDFKVFSEAANSGQRLRGFVVPGGADTSRKALDRMTEMAREAGAGGLVWMNFDGQGSIEDITSDEIRSPVSRFFAIEELIALASDAGVNRGDLLLLAVGEDKLTSRVLDVLRRHVATERNLASDKELCFVFVTEFPMFEWNETDERWSAMHHLFTAPFEDDIPLLQSDPGAVRSRAYDLVANGWELSSGSIRIHSRDLQEQVLLTLGLTLEEARIKFGHMLDAFEFGTPPHGGFAPGIDRTVALFAGEKDIREVIAFPKTKSASDLLMGAPSNVSREQLDEVHIVTSQLE